MGEFFKPWRRKVGVLTLVIACVFAAGWVRSGVRYDVITIYDPWDYEIVVWSMHGKMTSTRLERYPDSRYGFWGTGVLDAGDRPYGPHLAIPYWCVVIPLTLLSAYLLLSKPRLAKPKSESS